MIIFSILFVIISGLCSLLRYIVRKFSPDIHQTLLGHQNNCLSAPAEVSTWTKFCEIDLPRAIGSKHLVLSNDSYRARGAGGGVHAPPPPNFCPYRKENSNRQSPTALFPPYPSKISLYLLSSLLTQAWRNFFKISWNKVLDLPTNKN